MPKDIVIETCPAPECNLGEREIEQFAEELTSYSALLRPGFARSEQSEWSKVYVRGLLGNTVRKNIERIALEQGVNVRSLQHFMSQSPWATEPMIAIHQADVGETLGEKDGVVLMDESGVVKQGADSVGVGSQYCGSVGKVANSQNGVYLGYTSRLGYSLLDGQLFMPEEWFTEAYASKRAACGVPEELTMQTKPEIGLSLLQCAVERGTLPFAWVAADALYGDSPAFRDRVAALNKWYFTEVRCTSLVWQCRPEVYLPAWKGRGRRPTRLQLRQPFDQPLSVQALAAQLLPVRWSRATIKEGSKGPIVCDFAFVRIVEARAGLPGPEVWLAGAHRARRNLDEPSVLKFYFSNAPATIKVSEFFRTLAGTHGEQAIGIILSGTGSDGTVGLQCIKEEGGLTIVQAPADASYDGMPQSAIAMGVVDLILPIQAISTQLIAYAASVARVPTPDVHADSSEPALLQQILTHLRMQTGQDFTRYKRSTLIRRIRRRMQIHQIDELGDYLRFLSEHKEEGELLCQDFLISVTQFFRDPAAFAELNQLVIPQLFTGKGLSPGKGTDEPVRVWVAGCATGEEAYSLAILLMEYTDYLGHLAPIQIFATDLNERALRRAREGFYSDAIQAHVSPERLTRFFIQKRGGYQVKRELRELVIFAPHNLLKDPPFSKVDLIVCRNLLIYLQRDVQRQLFELFHYALRPQGYLWLGAAETLAEGKLFHELSKSHRFFQHQLVATPLPRLPNLALGSSSSMGWPKTTPAVAPDTGSLGDIHQQMLERYAPPSMLVNADYMIVHLSEHAGRYLQQAGGELTNHVLKRIRPELYTELTAALYTAFAEQQTVDVKPIRLKLEGEPRYVSLSVRPALEATLQGYLLVLFDERAALASAEATTSEGAPALNHVQAKELAQIKQRLSTTIEQFEISKENMRATNEELLSMNEELHSTTEELETSKEELQSMNEELIAVNAELKHKLEELSRANSDLKNLLTATDIAILFLDRQLRIKQFTPHVGQFFNLLATDQERPLAHITHKLVYPGLLEDAATVLRTQAPLQREVSSEGERWCLLRLLPYRTTEDQVDGVVITLVDMTERKQVEQQLAYHAHLLANMHDAVLATDPQFKLTVWNKGAEQMYGWRMAEALNRPLQEIVPTSGDAEVQDQRLRQLAATGRYSGETITYHRNGAAIETEGLVMALQGEDGQLSGYLFINRDISKRKQGEKRNADLFKEVARQGDLLRSLNTKLAATQENERKEIARELHDRVGQNLTALSLNLKLVQAQLHARLPGDDPLEASIKDMRTLVGQMTELIRDVMAELRPPMLDDYGLLTTLKWYTTKFAQRTGLDVIIRGAEPEPRLAEHIALGLFRIAQEALNNVVKHAQATRVTVSLTDDSQHVYLRIADNGTGLDLTTIDSSHPGGWGVLTMGERATAIGGRFGLESQPGDGVVVWVEVAR